MIGPGERLHEASGDTARSVALVLHLAREARGMPLLDLIAPPACLACGAPRGDPLCAGCRARLPWIPRDACPRCALPRPCNPCPAARAAFGAAWAPVAHAGAARELVLALKLRGSRSAADAMAAAIAARLGGGDPAAPLARVVLVPVPAAPERRRTRGFDHAELLARRLARRTGLPLAGCLARARGDLRQVGSGRGRRRGGPVVGVMQQPPE